MKNIRRRLIGEIAIRSGLDVVGIDLDGLLQRLILFDTVVLKSVRLKEFPFLVKAFGYAGLMELLSSDALEIYCEAISITKNIYINGKRTLPIGEYNFAAVQITDHKKFIHDCLQPISTLSGITLKQSQKLKRALVSKLVRPQENFATNILDQFDRDLHSGAPMIKRAVSHRLRQELGGETPDFFIKIEELPNRKFRTQTDLFEKILLSQEKTNDIIESGLGAIGNLNHRLGRNESCIGTFRF